MTEKGTAGSLGSRDRWAAQIAALDDTPTAAQAAREPVTADRIVRTALSLVEENGFDALTMRRVAAALHTGPATLYAHVRNKAELDDLLIGRLCAAVVLPSPDPANWRAQAIDVCRQVRDQYLRFPGISRAVFAAAPHSLDTLRITEGLLGILLTGGVAPRAAAWAIDAALLYVGAYCLEGSLRRDGVDGPEADRSEAIERFGMLPANRFPHTVAHAEELTSGDGHDRFDFTLELLFQGLAPLA